MKTVLVVIDKWKLGVYKKHLNLGGYEYTEDVKNFIPGIGLSIETETLSEITDSAKATFPETQKILSEL